MKFIKVIIDGKEYYQRVDDIEEIAVEENKESDSEPEIVDAKIEEGEEVKGAEKFKRDTKEFFERVGNGAKDLGQKIADGAKVIGEKITVGAKDLGAKIKEGTERLFNKDKSGDPESTESKLLRILPYMSKEDTHEVCLKLLEKEDALADVNISTIMPFLSSEDCDTVFKRCIEINNKNYELATAIPYVSASCLTEIVDNYIAGKYPELVIDELYPFLSDGDIKRLFYHIIKNEDKKTSQEE